MMSSDIDKQRRIGPQSTFFKHRRAQLNVPINNRIAKADAARDELQYRQSEVRVQQLHSQVRLQVGNAFIAVQQAQESYKAAVEARTLQEQALDVERAKFEAGIATAVHSQPQPPSFVRCGPGRRDAGQGNRRDRRNIVPPGGTCNCHACR